MRQRRTMGTGSVRARRRKDRTIAYMLKATVGGKDYVRTIDAKSKKEAFDMLPVFIAEIRSGEAERKKAEAERLSKQPTLAEWSATFLSSHVTQDPDRMATRAAYDSMLRLYLLPALGSYKLADITTPLVRGAFQDLYHQGRALRTIKLAFAVLHRCLDAAIEDRCLKENPMPKFAKLRLGENDTPAATAKRHALKAPEVAALLEASADDPELHLWIAIMASCGLRPGEANALRWSDVDVVKSILHVRGSAKKVSLHGEATRIWIGKTKTPSSRREVAFGPSLATLFITERERQEGMQRILRGREPNVRDIKSLLSAGSCVFCADPTTAEGLLSPRSPHNLYGRFTRAARAAGLPHISPHWLRHTAISHAIEAGTPLADASRRAGHTNPAITAAIYTHAVSEGEQKAAAIGDSLLVPSKAAEVEQIGANKGHGKGQVP